MCNARKVMEADIVDIRWAHAMVAKGVKACAILDTNLRCDPEEVEHYLAEIAGSLLDPTGRITACYLDMVRDPARLGKEYTGGDLLKPVLGAVETGHGVYSIFFAANEIMADLFQWTFRMIRSESPEDQQHAHAIIGLLCGYCPMAFSQAARLAP